MMKNILTIVFCGRNDNYLGDFKYRIQTAINYIGASCTSIGLKSKIEVIVVDWNSDSPLSKELRLLPDAYDICRYLTVSPQIARSHDITRRHVNTEMAINVGIRRASGGFILFSPADILYTETSLINLLAVLSGQRKTTFDPEKTVFCLDRKMLPWQLVEKKLTLNEWRRYIELCSRHLPHDRYFNGLNGGYGGLLLHRDLWWECQGFVENNTGWGKSDTEWGLRLAQKYPAISLEPFGVVVYDMAQKPHALGQRNLGMMRYANRISLDHPNWGLGTVAFEKSQGLYSDNLLIESDPATRPTQENAFPLIQQAWEKVLPKIFDERIKLNNSIEQVLLATLSWYCLTYWPRRYFEFNSHVGLTTLAYAKLCNFGEIYTFEECQHFESNDIQVFLEKLPHTQFYQSDFRGYSHVMTGDAGTVIERLRGIFLGKMEFDVAVLRCDTLKTPHQCLKMADDLINVLSKNGALFITAESLSLFNDFQDLLYKKLGEHYFLHVKNQPFRLLIKK